MRHKPVVKLSRGLGFPLTEKAAKYFERRPYPPGSQGRGNRRPPGAYKERLLEKQKLRFQYHVSEKQLQRAFDAAASKRGRTGELLVEDLETRLDAVVLRSGFAKTIYQARQFVSHGHIQVDGARIDRPAYRVKVGSVISVAPKSVSTTPFQAVVTIPNEGVAPPYLSVARSELKAELVRLPNRSEIPVICNEQLVVEYYAR